MRSVSVLLYLLAAPVWAQSPVVGSWTGPLEGFGLTVTFHVDETDGALTSTVDVPEQGAVGMPTGATTFEGGTLTIEVPAVGAVYTGTLDGDVITGELVQGAAVPLVLRRVTGDGHAPGRARADEPRPPFPYREEDVTVESVGGVTLAGTLTVPDGAGPFPAVVLVSGSGPQNRDEEILGHRPFRVLADHFARRGVAVLRYDDRGVAGSTGDYAAATTADLALDARAAVEHLAGRPEAASVGLVGHSEGGLIGPAVAGLTDALDYVVMLAGPGVSGREVLVYQLTRDLDGADPSAVGAYRRALDALLAELATGEAETATGRAVEAYRDALGGANAEAVAALGVPPADELARDLSGPWERHFVGYDPAPALRGLRVPALAVFGGRDQQVRASDNVPAVVDALADAPRGSAVVIVPGLNHLFQPSTTGSPAEYGAIDTSFDAGVMDLVADWILARAGGSRQAPATRTP